MKTKKQVVVVKDLAWFWTLYLAIRRAQARRDIRNCQTGYRVEISNWLHYGKGAY